MKRQFPLIVLLLGVAGYSLLADDLPKPLPFDRYAGMVSRSPFAVSSAPAVPQATPNFAKDLYIANAARSGDADIVTLQSAVDRNMKEYLSTKDENPHGYKIISIEWSDRLGETRVTISKDGQVAALSFNQALMAQAPPANMPAPAPVPVPPAGGGGPAAPGQYVPPRPAVPMPVATPIPHQRGLIRRTPSSGAANLPAGTTAAGQEKE